MIAFLILLSVPLTILVTLTLSREWSLLSHLLYVSGVGLAYVLSIHGYGSALTRILHFGTDGKRSDRIAADLVVGLSVLYFLFVVLNLTGIFRPFSVVCVILPGTMYGLLSVRKEMQSAYTLNWPVADRILLYGILFLAGLQIAGSWTPLIFYDAIQYHILAPLRYLESGRFVYIPLNFSTNTPMAMQLVLGSSAAFDRSGESYKFLTAILGFGMPAAVAWAAKEYGRRAALLGAFLTFGIGGFWLPQALGVIDLPIAAMMLSGCLFLYSDFSKQTTKIWIAALCFGLAVGSRYPAALFTGIAYLIFAIHVFVRKNTERRQLIKILCSSFVVVFLMALPWILKNTKFTGNPVYPLFQKQLDGYEWSAKDAEVLRGDTVGDRFGGLSDRQKLISFVRLLTSERLMGILLILCCAIGIFRFRVGSREWIFCLTGWITLLTWGWIHPLGGSNLTRFNAVTLLLFALSSAVLLARSNAVTIAAVLVAVFSAFMGIFSTDQLLDVSGSITNSDRRLEIVRLNVPAWGGIDYANKNLQQGESKIFMLGETRSFYCRVPCYAADAYHGTELAVLFSGNQEQWPQTLHSLGATHILLSLSELKRLQKKSYLPLPQERLDELAAWLRSLPTLYQDGQGTFLLTLPPVRAE